MATTKEDWAKQVIHPCPDWTLKRFDAMNWAIIRKGNETHPWYYGRLLHALQDLPHKLLNEGDKGCLRDIADQMTEIRKIIDRLDIEFLKDGEISI